MKNLVWASALLATQVIASAAYAQSPPPDKAAVRAERKAQGSEATRAFKSGEGDPKPEPKAKASKAERAAASQARKAEGTEAALEFTPGDGNPKPEATTTTRLSRAERSAGRKASRAEVSNLNKEGQLPSYGENYGAK